MSGCVVVEETKLWGVFLSVAVDPNPDAVVVVDMDIGLLGCVVYVDVVSSKDSPAKEYGA